MVTLMRPYGQVTHLIQFWSDVIFRMSCWDLPPDLLIEVRCWRWSMVLSWPAWPVMNCVTPRDICHACVTHVSRRGKSPGLISGQFMSPFRRACESSMCHAWASGGIISGRIMSPLRRAQVCISAPSLAHYVNLCARHSVWAGPTCQALDQGISPIFWINRTFVFSLIFAGTLFALINFPT